MINCYKLDQTALLILKEEKLIRHQIIQTANNTDTALTAHNK